MLDKTSNDSIENINILINKAIKEIKIANARAESAEQMLIQLRNNSQRELSNAYNQGYKKGLEDSNSGGTSKNENVDNKLVLKNN